VSRSVALGSVSKSLRKLLVSQIDPPVPVTLLGPDEPPGADRRINLFLHRVEEHPQLRNVDFQLKRGTADTLIAPPLPLVLTYLMTAYALSDADTGNADAHSILGAAMLVLHQHPVIPDNCLEDDLSGSTEQLRAVPIPMDAEEISRIWSTFGEPFRLSVQYQVSVVQLDQPSETERRMSRRVSTISVPPVRAPFEPPMLTGIQPALGPAGTARVTVTGRNLAGWQATVSMTGVEVAARLPLTDDSFEFTVPDLDRGFHQVSVDVSQLVRATFFFEVR
jgi:hypothetical protein